MERLTRTIVGLVAALTVLLVSTVPAYAAPVSAPEQESQVIRIVNQIRAQNGLPALTVSSELTTSARRYAQYMASAGFFGHKGPDGSTLVTRNEAAGYKNWSNLAENLAAGHTDAAAVVQGWMNSPSHKANLLSTSVREIGVGLVYQPGTAYVYYWAQEFGNRGTVPAKAAADLAPQPTTYAARSVAGATTAPAEPNKIVDSSGTLDNLGSALTSVKMDKATGRLVQVYQRAVLEVVPETGTVQRRLIGDQLQGPAAPPVASTDAPKGPTQFFPAGSNGLGHFVANYTRDGQQTYFKDFFDAQGGVKVLGYPKEEPVMRGGRWTQRFQAGMLEYHPEYDTDAMLASGQPARSYRVQMSLLGEEYLAKLGGTLE